MTNKAFPLGLALGFALGLAAALVAALFGARPAAADAPSPWDAVSVSGFVGGELRWFPEPPQHAGQYAGAEASLLVNPEFRWTGADRTHQVSLVPFLRLAGRDAERTHWDIREAFYRHNFGGGVELLAGVNKVFWGVAESRHLVDIVNQTDLVEDTDDEDKLGQPMIGLGLQREWGRLDLFVLPGFRTRTHAGDTGRPRGAKPIDDSLAEFESGRGRGAVDVAARYSHALGPVDLGVSLFRGTARDPRLVDKGAALAPHYDQITQAGIDTQYTTGPWLLKFEGIAREGQGRGFLAAVTGFEYTLFQAFGSDADWGFLAEYQYDGRDPNDGAGVLADDDVFLGTRLTLNDVQDAQALAGVIIDRHDGTLQISVEASRRIGQAWKAEVEGRFLTNVDRDNGASAFRRDGFVNVRLSRYF